MYPLETGKNTVEIAVSVLKEWQGKGIAGVILTKLAQSAIESGYSGLVAYTPLRNTSMIKLFKKLSYQVKTRVGDEFFVMICRFEEPA
jgi:L-amino acid N-acyltransferase YncA